MIGLSKFIEQKQADIKAAEVAVNSPRESSEQSHNQAANSNTKSNTNTNNNPRHINTEAPANQNHEEHLVQLNEQMQQHNANVDKVLFSQAASAESVACDPRSVCIGVQDFNGEKASIYSEYSDSSAIETPDLRNKHKQSFVTKQDNIKANMFDQLKFVDREFNLAKHTGSIARNTLQIGNWINKGTVYAKTAIHSGATSIQEGVAILAPSLYEVSSDHIAEGMQYIGKQIKTVDGKLLREYGSRYLTFKEGATVFFDGVVSAGPTVDLGFSLATEAVGGYGAVKVASKACKAFAGSGLKTVAQKAGSVVFKHLDNIDTSFGIKIKTPELNKQIPTKAPGAIKTNIKPIKVVDVDASINKPSPQTTHQSTLGASLNKLDGIIPDNIAVGKAFQYKAPNLAAKQTPISTALKDFMDNAIKKSIKADIDTHHNKANPSHADSNTLKATVIDVDGNTIDVSKMEQKIVLKNIEPELSEAAGLKLAKHDIEVLELKDALKVESDIFPDHEPSIKKGTKSFMIELKDGDEFIRVLGPNAKGSPSGNYLLLKKDIEGLTPSQIQSKFALPREPEYYSEVKISNPPKGHKVMVSIVGENFGAPGGGTQFFLAFQIDKIQEQVELWFSAKQSLPKNGLK